MHIIFLNPTVITVLSKKANKQNEDLYRFSQIPF